MLRPAARLGLWSLSVIFEGKPERGSQDWKAAVGGRNSRSQNDLEGSQMICGHIR